MNKHNAYHVTFSGHYMGGHMIVVAESKRKAFNIAKKKLAIIDLFHKNQDLSMDDVFLLDMSHAGSIVISDGDY